MYVPKVKYKMSALLTTNKILKPKNIYNFCLWKYIIEEKSHNLLGYLLQVGNMTGYTLKDGAATLAF